MIVSNEPCGHQYCELDDLCKLSVWREHAKLFGYRRESVKLIEELTGPWAGRAFTCDGCPWKLNGLSGGGCVFAYDPYNTDGDCLELK